MGDGSDVQAVVVDKAFGMYKVGVVSDNTAKTVPPTVGIPRQQVV